MERVVKGSHLLTAIENTSFDLGLSHKLKTIAYLVQPGFNHEELLELILNDEEIPEQYLDKLKEFGMKFSFLDLTDEHVASKIATTIDTTDLEKTK